MIVRAWVEPDAGPNGLRAKVLVITGKDADVREVDGAVAGLAAILDLVEEALRSAFPVAGGNERRRYR